MTLAELGGQVTSGSRGWAKFYADHGRLFVRITNLQRDNIHLDLTNSRFVDIDSSNAEARRTLLAPGDLLVSITADIGIIGYIDDAVPTPAYINQHIARVRLDPRLTDSRFVAYYLASWEPQRLFVGATDQGAKAGMNLTTVASLKTLVPPLPEQTRIADALADVDEQIATLERLITKKQAVKQGMMQQLLTGRTRLPGFTLSWEDVTLSNLATVDAEVLPASTNSKLLLDYISLENVDRGRLLGSTQVAFRDAPSRARRVVELNDVLFGTVRPNLQSHLLYTGELRRPIASTGFAVIRTNRSGDPAFVFNLLMSHLTTVQIDRIIAGSNYPAVSSGDVRKLEFSVPLIDEQRAIAGVLTDAEAELEILRSRLDKARDVKAGMMQELLTGRTRLPVEVAS
ncbi:restriction endonuclease subunit S [Mycolicibacterium arseniciresistens]|uniref:Restriction endonuclease subunit S n=1 Tax=Mycolicibacterium arseniciresistens TaxID=3062257 RepID=A0ABT8UE21_9MYCO|nr:restriction endonuclease subunit S [Mycolicibacterium arseniciresistens]MDO3636036.1 restriction endonuclease subunit S [Mycolicibacterium arseniciresistens]